VSVGEDLTFSGANTFLPVSCPPPGKRAFKKVSEQGRVRRVPAKTPCHWQYAGTRPRPRLERTLTTGRPAQGWVQETPQEP